MERKNLGAIPYTYPQSVYVIASYDENEVPDGMVSIWAGITAPEEITLYLNPEHASVKNIMARKAFTIGIATEDYITQCDFLGLVSAAEDPDKFKKSGFTATKSKFVDAPIINELPVCIECNLISYDEKTFCMKAEIINVSVDEAVYTDGKVDILKVRPVTFDPFNSTYNTIGGRVADAYKEGRKLI